MRRALQVALASSVLLVAGCHGGGMTRSRGSIAAAEPGLAASTDGVPAVAATPPAAGTGSMAWVDRHPLFSKPRDYYENSGRNKVVKAAAATVVGIPAGIFGEMRQIVVGTPRASTY